MIAMTVKSDGLSAEQIAQAVTDRKLSALDATEAALARMVIASASESAP